MSTMNSQTCSPSSQPRCRWNLGLVAAVLSVVVVSGFFCAARLSYSQALAGAVFVVTLPLGAALFAAICICMGARWWHPLQSVFVDAARMITIPCVALGVVLLLGTTTIYSWTYPEVAATHLIHAKHDWLNLTFFLGRSIGVLLLWIWMVLTLTKRIRKAFEDPSAAATAAMARAGIVFCILFGLSISVAWWDWLMSIEPEWFSTMQGVYGFSSSFLGGIALVTLMALSRERDGQMALTDAQAHDLGKMLFAFCFFWGYIWFCQMMLIWYANIPEEGGWFVHRLTGGWAIYFALNGILTFFVPFIALMSAKAKKNRARLASFAIVILIGRAFDIWMSVAPSLEPEPRIPIFGIATVGFIAIATYLVGTRHTRETTEKAG